MAKFKKKTDRTPLVLICLLAVVVAAMGGSLWWLVGGPSPYDGVDTKTFCRVDGHRSINVILIDATDPFTPEQGARLFNELRRIRDSVPRFSQIDIFAIDATKPNGIGPALFHGCNPGNMKETDRFRENARIVAKKYDEGFEQPFRKALLGILASKIQDRSPIIEAIEASTVQIFGALPVSADVDRHLTIVSDMLQNTDALSFYHAPIPAFPGFKHTDAFRLHRPALSQVEVSVLEINRPSRDLKEVDLRRNDVAEFWTRYLVAQGATLATTFWDVTKI